MPIEDIPERLSVTAQEVKASAPRLTPFSQAFYAMFPEYAERGSSAFKDGILQRIRLLNPDMGDADIFLTNAGLREAYGLTQLEITELAIRDYERKFDVDLDGDGEIG